MAEVPGRLSGVPGPHTKCRGNQLQLLCLLMRTQGLEKYQDSFEPWPFLMNMQEGQADQTSEQERGTGQLHTLLWQPWGPQSLEIMTLHKKAAFIR